MPTGEPQDGFLYLTITLMIDSYNLQQLLIYLYSGSSDRLFSCVSLGDGNIGWAVDVLGNMWFLCGVTMDRPRGNGIWWQVVT